jgi:hypothetical protein
VDSPHEVAAIIRAREQLGLKGGLLVTVPVPVEAEWPAEEAQTVINQALSEAQQGGIVGKAVTPYLLQKVSDLSGARSKKANIALLLNNARVAAQIAQALAGEQHNPTREPDVEIDTGYLGASQNLGKHRGARGESPRIPPGLSRFPKIWDTPLFLMHKQIVYCKLDRLSKLLRIAGGHVIMAQLKLERMNYA